MVRQQRRRVMSKTLRRCRCPRYSASSNEQDQVSASAPNRAPFERAIHIRTGKLYQRHAIAALARQTRACRCGCGQDVTEARKFVSQKHYNLWLSRERYVGRPSEPSPGTSVASPGKAGSVKRIRPYATSPVSQSDRSGCQSALLAGGHRSTRGSARETTT
jgi:hypothetical protein